MTPRQPLAVTFIRTGDLAVEIVWDSGFHRGRVTADSDEELMMAIGRFVWWSLESDKMENNE